MEGDDFDRSWLPRSFSDRADGYTTLCLDMLCPRSLPARSAVGLALLQVWLQGASEPERRKQGKLPDVGELATTLYRLYVRERPSAVPFTVEGFSFEHEMVALPYWAIAEPHFQDGWKAYGGQYDPNAEHSQLYTPRPRRESTDWVLMSTSKLWLPLGYGPPSARNALPRSVVDAARRIYALGIMPRPYRPKIFGPRKGTGAERRLRSPRDVIDLYGTDATLEAARREGALPGAVGGFRTFRAVRLVGRDAGSAGAAAAQAGAGGPVRWRVAIRGGPLTLYCRSEPRPWDTVGAASGSAAEGSVAFRACSAGLRRAPAPAKTAEGSAGGAAAAQQPPVLLFEACGSPAELNAALSLLAYAPTRGLSTPPPSGGAGGPLDARASEAELAAHFANLLIEASPGCSPTSPAGGGVSAVATPPVVSVALSALLDDVEEHVTVIAHCAERCHLLDRLATSFREVYGQLPIAATCECGEAEDCPEPRAAPHKSIPGMTLVTVPYDFGLSRGKSLLLAAANTEFVLVLDDDFVFSFHSCLECMLWRMRSRHHSQWRPFDILGFPILEDERMFGAFRGQLRVTNRQLFVEPFVEQTTPDGCVRVDICPMVFLARTARIRLFKFQQDLQVGEHEQFFYSNAHFGAQVAVCFDSSFPHFRVNTMSAGYVKRRERMPELMQSAFGKLGFERAMYLFKKYATDNMTDYDELLEKNTPPWYISDDTCGPRPSPPVAFAQVLVVILSTGDAEGARYRNVLRGLSGSSRVWLQRCAQFGASNFRWMFAVVVDDSEAGVVQAEQDTYGDILLLPAGPRSRAIASPDEGTTEDFLRLFALLRDFQFRWLLMVRQDILVSFSRVIQALQQNDQAEGKVLGSWTTSTPAAAGGGLLDPRFFAMSRDVFALLSAPALSSRLAYAGPDPEVGDLASLRGGLNAWLRPFTFKRLTLPGIHLGVSGAGATCSQETLAWGPVSPEQLHGLSEDRHACGGAFQ
eukprot:TRINITY_DN3663_c0_g2_i2.p1 TRINITY_DN3663_c0_g2~~TRINITY_DN3663_c0_g2_i2.p1  ORF type:complete len:1136 (+),score=204.34 TRINITY_DN3663_c0_g2_i2:476-3409(+)